MRRALATLAVTAVAVVLLAGFDTHPPRTVNPSSALSAAAPPRVAPDPNARSATSPAYTTPFSVIQVQATLTHGRLTAVRTVLLSGDGPHTQALNARAEPILRAEALRAGSAKVDLVTGATYTSRSWLKALRAAIAKARE
jgi:uncharacterized protein with FMN-binding domain